MNAMYFAGEDIDSLIPHFNAAVADLSISCLPSEYYPEYRCAHYGEVLQIIAFGILLETDDNTMLMISIMYVSYQKQGFFQKSGMK